MKRIISITIIAVAVTLTTAAYAVKAKPGVMLYMQPDGTSVEIILHGDEYSSFVTDKEGNILNLDEAGFYVPIEGLITRGETGVTTYARTRKGVAFSSGNVTTRSGDPKYRFSSSAFPTKGTPHSLVILVEYPDYDFTVENPLEYYNEFLNGDNFSQNGATGSVRKYFSENSLGAFVPTFDVFGPVKLSQPRKFYGGGNEDNAFMMVVEGVKAIDAEVDFSIYDHNSDGYVDNVYIIYAHKGEADSRISEAVWPHSWELEEAGYALMADGVKFNTYGCSNELDAYGGVEGIGTFTHEFGHVLGLPDLYNTVNAYDLSTPLDWSVMDQGNYNNENRTPCNLSSFERYCLGWLSPDEIVMTGDYTLGNLADSNRAFLMTTEEKPDEFFIMDYRKQEGWDEFLPYHGLLIWHIDFKQMMWDQNVVNNTMSHQYVRLIRADNDNSIKTVVGDPFPGMNGVTAFTTSTVPALLSWQKKPLNVTSIHNIREENDGKAYFSATVSEFRGDAGVGGTISEAGFILTGQTVSVAEGSVTVYDIHGRKRGTVVPDRPLSLEKGIYIINGNKVVL